MDMSKILKGIGSIVHLISLGRNAKFLENDLISGSDQFKDITYDKDHYEVEPFTSSDRLFVIHTP